MQEKIDITWIYLSEIHLGHKTISFKEIVGTGKKEINFSEVEVRES